MHGFYQLSVSLHNVVTAEKWKGIANTSWCSEEVTLIAVQKPALTTDIIEGATTLIKVTTEIFSNQTYSTRLCLLSLQTQWCLEMRPSSSQDCFMKNTKVKFTRLLIQSKTLGWHQRSSYLKIPPTLKIQKSNILFGTAEWIFTKMYSWNRIHFRLVWALACWVYMFELI